MERFYMMRYIVEFVNLLVQIVKLLRAIALHAYLKHYLKIIIAFRNVDSFIIKIKHNAKVVM